MSQIPKMLLLAALLASCVSEDAPSARFIVQHDWVGRGEWIAADLHVHTRFSDGAHTVAEVVERARAHGCGAIAITDHASRTLRAATPDYQADIEAARTANPDFMILGGIEWNVPPYESVEHVIVLAPPGPREWSTLAEFRARFDDFDLGSRPKPGAAEALRWLTGQRDGSSTPVVFYGHPSRKDGSSMDNVADLESWRLAADIVIGFEGAPGHQGGDVVGSYLYTEKTMDRWDPAAARPGDAWDTLLRRGNDVHGALAGSDFHAAGTADLNDFWPCQFSETWLYVPGRTPSGLFRALRAGTFFGAHGHVARDVELTASVEGLTRPAISGESIEVPAGTAVTLSVRFSVPERDWNGEPNRIDTVEFIITTPAGTSVSTESVIGPGPQVVSKVITADEHGLVVRARGRRVVADDPDLMFYTNAIRIAAPGGRTRRGGL